MNLHLVQIRHNGSFLPRACACSENLIQGGCYPWPDWVYQVGHNSFSCPQPSPLLWYSCINIIFFAGGRLRAVVMWLRWKLICGTTWRHWSTHFTLKAGGLFSHSYQHCNVLCTSHRPEISQHIHPIHSSTVLHPPQVALSNNRPPPPVPPSVLYGVWARTKDTTRCTSMSHVGS